MASRNSPSSSGSSGPPLAVVLALAGLVLLATAGAFAFADFTVASHETHSESSIGTSKTGNATANLSEGVGLYVAGDGWLTDHLETHMVSALESRGVAVELLDSPETTHDGPVLVATVARANVIYSPITPLASVRTEFVYAENGNTTLATNLLTQGGPVRHDAENQYVMRGQVTISDTTRGVVSWPAYQRHVAETAAEKTVAEFVKNAR